MNKKGFLLAEETLKVILAVIAIGFLAYLLFALYRSNADSKELELAKESLNFIQEGISDEKAEIDVYNPKKWNIGSWPHDVEVGFISKRMEGQMPQACLNVAWSNCICICKKNSAESCGEDGICINNDQKLQITNGNIQINDPPITLKVNYQTKIISKK